MAQELFANIVRGCRASLARGITLIESSKSDSFRRDLVKLAFQHNINNKRNSLRIAISGSPGAGKSTFIESFGLHVIDKEKKKIAVLAIDPSSVISGGSLLGDKTRMANLSRHPSAYIRPSPNRGRMGGVTRSTGEALLLCEAGGFDIIFIETVGVGQSEHVVADFCDIFALLVAPAGGDEIQAIKKGIVELANVIVVTKSDGDLVKAARKVSAEFISATKYINFGLKPIVKRCSAKTKDGIPEIWMVIKNFYENEDEIRAKRQEQRIKLLRTYLADAIMQRLDSTINLKHYEEKLRQNEDLLIWDVIDDILQKI